MDDGGLEAGVHLDRSLLVTAGETARNFVSTGSFETPLRGSSSGEVSKAADRPVVPVCVASRCV
ncbi:Hypothetical protein BN69_1617 [Methylocystis sp. SC2]|nr:Hypothetical protein BN69_1617 [Methylocystis sp. SC2]